MIEIESTQNPKIKEAITLMDRRNRDKSQLFVIEGYREVSRAVLGNVKIVELFFCPPLFLGTNEPELIDKIESRGGKLYRCSEKAFRKLSYRDRPDGVLAVAVQEKKTVEQIPLSENPFLVVAEAIEKPGNLGTILRSSDAANVDGVIIADRCTDIFNPNVVRASVGTLFTVPVVEAEGDAVLDWLEKKGIQIVAATPDGDLEFTQADFKGPIAIAVGTEQLGLSDKWMKRASLRVKIPMLGVADSLNVAQATTLLLYEVIRQRRQ